jgi:hypothetical protein
MSNEEYTHQNFWKKSIKFITTWEEDIRVQFVPLPLFDEPFCKQVKKKKDDKTI